MPQTIDFEWLVEGEIRSIPTSASNSKPCLDKELQTHRAQVPAKVPATF